MRHIFQSPRVEFAQITDGGSYSHGRQGLYFVHEGDVRDVIVGTGRLIIIAASAIMDSVNRSMQQGDQVGPSSESVKITRVTGNKKVVARDKVQNQLVHECVNIFAEM